MLPEGEKHWGGPVVIGGDNLPSLVRIGLTDLSNIGGGASGPPGPPGSGTTVVNQPLDTSRACMYLKKR